MVRTMWTGAIEVKVGRSVKCMAEAKAYKMIPHCTKDEISYTVDELVRCECCKHGDLDEYGCINCDKCEIHEPNWFCADGERKKE